MELKKISSKKSQDNARIDKCQIPDCYPGFIFQSSTLGLQNAYSRSISRQAFMNGPTPLASLSRIGSEI